MSLGIEQIFPALIAHEKLEQFAGLNNLYYQKIIDIYNENPQVANGWAGDTYNTLDLHDLKNEPLFADLISTCVERVSEFSNILGYTPKKIITNNVWANVAKTGQYQEFHTHANNHFSLVYYVKTPENCGDIIFKSHDTNMFILPASGYAKYCNIKPVESLILIFKSNLEHMVKKNLSPDNRVSIAMNFIVE